MRDVNPQISDFSFRKYELETNNLFLEVTVSYTSLRKYKRQFSNARKTDVYSRQHSQICHLSLNSSSGINYNPYDWVYNILQDLVKTIGSNTCQTTKQSYKYSFTINLLHPSQWHSLRGGITELKLILDLYNILAKQCKSS